MKNSATKPKWGFRDALLVILTIICLILGLNIVLILVGAEKTFENSDYKSFIMPGLFLLQEAIFILPLYFLVFRRLKTGFSAFGFNMIGLWPTAKWMLKAFGIVFIFNFLFALIVARFGELPGFGGQESHLPFFGDSTSGLIIAVLVLVIIAPVIEEIVFRGFLLRTFLNKWSPWVASLCSASIFAIIHFEFQSVGIILFLALVLNWIFIRSKSIWPCIIFHIINNGLAFLMEWLVWVGYVKM